MEGREIEGICPQASPLSKIGLEMEVTLQTSDSMLFLPDSTHLVMQQALGCTEATSNRETGYGYTVVIFCPLLERQFLPWSSPEQKREMGRRTG